MKIVDISVEKISKGEESYLKYGFNDLCDLAPLCKIEPAKKKAKSNLKIK